MHRCKYCGVELSPDNTYKHGPKSTTVFPVGYHRHCKKCHNIKRDQRRLNNKTKVVELLGGSCNCCGYKKFLGALEVHHTDPSVKDKTIYDYSYITDEEQLTKELSTCVLLCANCHRETHGGLHPEFMSPPE